MRTRLVAGTLHAACSGRRGAPLRARTTTQRVRLTAGRVLVAVGLRCRAARWVARRSVVRATRSGAARRVGALPTRGCCRRHRAAAAAGRVSSSACASTDRRSARPDHSSCKRRRRLQRRRQAVAASARLDVALRGCGRRQGDGHSALLGGGGHHASRHASGGVAHARLPTTCEGRPPRRRRHRRSKLAAAAAGPTRREHCAAATAAAPTAHGGRVLHRLAVHVLVLSLALLSRPPLAGADSRGDGGRRVARQAGAHNVGHGHDA